MSTVKQIVYIAVPTRLTKTILEEGYTASRRSKVPCSLSPRRAVNAYTSHHADECDLTVLEVVDLPSHLLDRDACKINSKHLDKEHLHLCVSRPNSNGYEEVPCPFCGKMIPEEAESRGQVGLFRFVHQAFQASPCCVDKNKERQDRLDGGERQILYHQTTRTCATQIWEAGGKLLRGSHGIAGGGIYFAQTARETEWKCDLRDHSDERVVLQCEVAVGNVKPLSRDADRGTTFASLVREGFDSTLVDRGTCEKAGPGYGKPSGDEIIVYSWDQVRVLCEVPRDEVPGDEVATDDP